MNIIYKITYIPHLNNKTEPYFYIGSKYNYKEGYLGSVSSQRKTWFSDGMELKKWWKENTQNNPSNFLIEIIEEHPHLTPKELAKRESDIQRELNVLSSEYFNSAIHGVGFVSGPKSEETKRKMAESTKRFWESPEGLLKKQRLIEKNTRESSKRMKELWKTNDAFILANSSGNRRPTSDETRKIRSKNSKKAWQDGKFLPKSEELKKKLSEHSKGLICWFDGVNYKKSKECPGEGWIKKAPPRDRKSIEKASKTSLGMVWWNNGYIQTKSKECPGEGWIRGKFKCRK